MHVLENLILIPTVISGDIVEALKGFNSELEKDEFDEMIKLYTTNCNMIKEFAVTLANDVFFPSINDADILMRGQFMEKMQKDNFSLTKPQEIRRLFTAYVLKNKNRALLPTKVNSLFKKKGDDS